MAQTKRYFRLLESIGVEAPVLVDGYDESGQPIEKENPRAGELAPLNSVGVRVLTPAMHGDGLVMEPRSVELTKDGAYVTEVVNGKPRRVGLPNTDDGIHDEAGRILALSSNQIIDGIVQSGQYEEIDQPKKSASAGKES